MWEKKESLFQLVTELFNHRISQHLAGNALHLRLGCGFIASVKYDFEILALPHILHAFVAHLAQRAVDSLALRIEHGFLERHVNVSLHKRKIIPFVAQHSRWLNSTLQVSGAASAMR